MEQDKSENEAAKRTENQDDEFMDNNEYFASYDEVEVHRLMLQDKPRTDAYRDAIFNNSKLFEGRVVMDVGAGTGILSLFAMQVNAKKVYAVEASGMVETLREIISLNDKNGIIEVIHGKAEDIELPGGVKVDIIISEWMGFYLLHESMLDSVIAARDKHLQEDGLMFPSHSSIQAAPVQLDKYYEERFVQWDAVYGFDMTPMAQKAVQAKLSGSQPDVMVLPPDSLLSAPVSFLDLDLRWVTREEVAEVKDRKFVSVDRNGKFHGLAIWFSVTFNPMVYDEDVEISVVELNTGPSSPETHWKQTVVVLPRENMSVEEDEVIGWQLVMQQSSQNPRHYNIALGLLDPAEDEHPTPCNCHMARCELMAALLKKEEEDFEEISTAMSMASDK